MNRLLLTVALFIGGCLFVTSQIKSVTLYTTDGAQTILYLSQRPKAVYDNQNLIITTSSSRIEYPIEDLHKFVFEDESTNTKLDNLTPEESEKKIQVKNDIASITGLGRNETVSVYTMTGLKTASFTSKEGGTISIPLSSFPKGGYIISSKSVTFKFIKK